jgi:mannose-1-phosphate guanylyltransferase
MDSDLKALLVAAGVGSRLRPLTDVLPKCLMPINGRALLGLWLDALVNDGVADIIVNLHYLPDLVREYVSQCPYNDYVTLSYEETLLGTAGTLLKHKEHFSGSPILFAHADNLTLFSVSQFYNAHRKRPAHAAMTMMSFTAKSPELCGILELDSSGIVVKFHEKAQNPPGNLANAAVYILEPEILNFIESLGKAEVDFSTEVLPHFIGRIFTYYNDLYHRDIGAVQSLLRAQLEYPCVEALHGVAFVEDKTMSKMLAQSNGELAQNFFRHVYDTF